MRRFALLPLLALLAAGCSSAGESTAASELTVPDKPLGVGDKAPPFDLKGDDGKTYSLASLTEKGPAFVYFIKSDCSANPAAAPHFDKLYAAYGDKIRFIAVVQGPDDLVNEWRKQYKPQYVGLYDGKADITKYYGLTESQHTFLIDHDRKILGSYQGYGQDALVPLNEAMAKQAGVPVAKIDFSDAPDKHAFG